MLKYEQVAGLLRFYNEDFDDFSNPPPYVASCTVVWEEPDVIWIKGFSGKVTRKHIVDLINFAFENKVRLIKANRLSGTMPFVTYKKDNYCEIDTSKVADKVNRFRARYASTT